MRFEFGDYQIDVDAERTKAFYASLPQISAACTCIGCRNFVQAVADLPETVTALFDALGVDRTKPAEAYVNCANPDGTLFYQGFYHLCGRILAGDRSQEQSADGFFAGFRWVQLTDSFSVGFFADCDLLEDGFPAPVIQLEIAAHLPWVLPEGHNYPASKKKESLI